MFIGIILFCISLLALVFLLVMTIFSITEDLYGLVLVGFGGVLWGIFTFGVIPDAFPRMEMSSTEIPKEQYSVYKTDNQLGIIYKNKVIVPIDYAGFKALENGEVKLYEQKMQTTAPHSCKEYIEVKAFDVHGNLIGSL